MKYGPWIKNGSPLTVEEFPEHNMIWIDGKSGIELVDRFCWDGEPWMEVIQPDVPASTDTLALAIERVAKFYMANADLECVLDAARQWFAAEQGLKESADMGCIVLEHSSRVCTRGTKSCENPSHHKGFVPTEPKDTAAAAALVSEVLKGGEFRKCRWANRPGKVRFEVVSHWWDGEVMSYRLADNEYLYTAPRGSDDGCS